MRKQRRSPEYIAASRIYRRAWYRRNTEYAKAKTLERKRVIASWFQDYKATLKCSNCPENHPRCLDFHHRNRAEKLQNVSLAISHGWSIEKLKTEIAKCDVLCSNCHRKQQFEEERGVAT